MLIHQNHAAGEENGSIMVGMFVCLCLARKKPSEREFFVPAGTDLGVKLLTKIGHRKTCKLVRLQVFNPPRLAPYHPVRCKPGWVKNS
jgi:hypothetical protein